MGIGNTPPPTTPHLTHKRSDTPSSEKKAEPMFWIGQRHPPIGFSEPEVREGEVRAGEVRAGDFQVLEVGEGTFLNDLRERKFVTTLKCYLIFSQQGSP